MNLNEQGDSAHFLCINATIVRLHRNLALLGFSQSLHQCASRFVQKASVLPYVRDQTCRTSLGLSRILQKNVQGTLITSKFYTTIISSSKFTSATSTGSHSQSLILRGHADILEIFASAVGSLSLGWHSWAKLRLRIRSQRRH